MKDFYDYPTGTWLYFYNPSNSAMGLYKKIDKKHAIGVDIGSKSKGWIIQFIEADMPLPNFIGKYLKAIKRLYPYKGKIIEAIFNLEEHMEFGF